MHACDSGVINEPLVQSRIPFFAKTVEVILPTSTHALQSHLSSKPSPSGEQKWTLQSLCKAISVATRGERIDVNGRASSPATATGKKARQELGGARPTCLAIAGRAVCPTPVRLERCAPSGSGTLPTDGPTWILRAPDTPVWTWTVAECHSVDVCTATIEMPQDGYLILKSACRGLTFRDVHFRGVLRRPPAIPKHSIRSYLVQRQSDVFTPTERPAWHGCHGVPLNSACAHLPTASWALVSKSHPKRSCRYIRAHHECILERRRGVLLSSDWPSPNLLRGQLLRRWATDRRCGWSRRWLV